MNKDETFYKEFMQEVYADQESRIVEDGGTTEQIFTEKVIDLLSDIGTTENAEAAYYEHNLGKAGQMKINGYGMSESYDTLDLFITIFEDDGTAAGEDASNIEIPTIQKSHIDTAKTRISNFFEKCWKDNYFLEIEESSPIWEFASTLSDYDELKKNLSRVNVFVITNCKYTGREIEHDDVAEFKVYYNIKDILSIKNMIELQEDVIDIDFEQNNYDVPCLHAPIDNDDYQAYLCIFPAYVLADLYELYGDRLLEQNVRSFLDFRGKVNKGIRSTLNGEDLDGNKVHNEHMFFAFNNGLAITADEIELNSAGNKISRISNLQIVNGGQTTASIFKTRQKDKVSLDDVFVQAKISVVKDKDNYAGLVAQISKYANSQNKVSDADFSSNNEKLVQLARQSETTLAPMRDGQSYQTYWYFERTRGSYRQKRNFNGTTKAAQKAFDNQYPKKQMFDKTELAKFVNAYKFSQQPKNGKPVLGPHLVAKGAQKNFNAFLRYNKIENVNKAVFEEIIGKAILFKTGVKLYGRKPNSIGDMRQSVVPYSIALIGVRTGYRLNFRKIWKNQSLSEELGDFLYDLMVEVDRYITDTDPASHHIEWSKKAECWQKVKEHTFNIDFSRIKNDLMTDAEVEESRRLANIDEKDYDDALEKEELEKLSSVPFDKWREICHWGSRTETLSLIETNFIRRYVRATNFDNEEKIDSDLRKELIRIYENLRENYPDILGIEEPEVAVGDNVNERQAVSHTSAGNDHATSDKVAEALEIPEAVDSKNYDTLVFIKKMYDWDMEHKVLENWKRKMLKDIVTGDKYLSRRRLWGVRQNYNTLASNGFSEDPKKIFDKI